MKFLKKTAIGLFTVCALLLGFCFMLAMDYYLG